MVTPCKHIWKIATPSGAKWSHGVCQKCGDERDFDNVTPTDAPKPKTRDNGTGYAQRAGVELK